MCRNTACLTAVALLTLAGSVALSTGDAFAFSRGLASKMRRMRDSAYAERFNNASEAFKAGNFEACAREASLALGHAADTNQTAAAHHLIAAAYLRLGDLDQARPHQAWLAEHLKNTSSASK